RRRHGAPARNGRSDSAEALRHRRGRRGLSRGAAQLANLRVARAFALAASSSRFRGGATVSSEWRKRVATPAIPSTAAANDAALAFDGRVNPLIFRTNWSEAARISSSVTGGSKLKRILIFRHIAHKPHPLHFIVLAVSAENGHPTLECCGALVELGRAVDTALDLRV